jgi:hypothetical protein
MFLETGFPSWALLPRIRDSWWTSPIVSLQSRLSIETNVDMVGVVGIAESTQE